MHLMVQQHITKVVLKAYSESTSFFSVKLNWITRNNFYNGRLSTSLCESQQVSASSYKFLRVSTNISKSKVSLCDSQKVSVSHFLSISKYHEVTNLEVLLWLRSFWLDWGPQKPFFFLLKKSSFLKVSKSSIFFSTGLRRGVVVITHPRVSLIPRQLSSDNVLETTDWLWQTTQSWSRVQESIVLPWLHSRLE